MSDKQNTPAYQDTSLPFDERAKDLVSRMTLTEKITQMLNGAPPLEHLGVPGYDWWNECLHGVARAGTATVFPQAIGMAASWNTELFHKVADVISDEARAKHHEFAKKGDRAIYKGLTFWTPNINIFRDPRWGRGHETYGEDPYLTGRMGVAFCKGLQGDDPKYLKLVATPKHYAVHSGPEKDRHSFDAVATPKDLRETYLPAFKDCVQEAGAYSVMGAYNRTNGEPCCASKTLLQDILRDEWGFEGYVVSDCGAICDISDHHKVVETRAQAAAMAVKNGCDLNCGVAYSNLLAAVDEGLITEAELDVALVRLFTARMKLGMFDPEEMVPYSKIPYEVNDCEEHRAYALEMARESIVLLKNRDSLLPLSKDVKTIAVIGPNAEDLNVLLGNYFGTPSKYVTPRDGIQTRVSPQTRVLYAQGCAITGEDKHYLSEAVYMAEKADVAVLCIGLHPSMEGEEGDAANSDGGGDRIRISLPGVQQDLLEAVAATGTPVVVVLMNGSGVCINWAQDNVPAIVEAWYPGEEGGTAIADVLFGDYNPGGRLPVTFVKSVEQLPPFADYSMKGRTYRYMTQEPLYPFGFGLSYTSFDYSNLKLNADKLNAGEDLQVSVKVKNSGKVAGDEVVQVYLTDLEASVDVPLRQLVSFKRIHLAAGEEQEVTFTVAAKQIALIDNHGNRILEPGKFKLTVGGSQGDNRSIALGAGEVLSAEFEVTGETIQLEY